MLFHSPEFLSLMAMALVAYLFFPRARITILAVANAFFYGVAGLPWLALFAGMAWLTYYCSLRVNRRHGRLFLWLGCAANLLNLGFFKYTNFIISNLPVELVAGLIGDRVLHVALPIGISFYTFQLMAYLIDVARDEVAPARSFAEFWVFIAFFAQLIAGPIMRARDFMPQIARSATIRVRSGQFKYGLYVLFVGLTKKVLLADTLAPLADKLFAGAPGLTPAQVWIASALFAFQIYFDFSAYSDMAVGIGHLFGYGLTQNFFTPYISSGPTEFWRRWHVTLSTWIRDYIYIPLGGSRVPLPRQAANIIIAMTLSGLWHGASWTFVIWGLYHGLLSAAEKYYRRYLESRLPERLRRSRAYSGLQIVAWNALILIGWVFFRISEFRVALSLVRRMVLPTSLAFSLGDALLLCLTAGLYALHWLERWVRDHEFALHDAWRRSVPTPLRGLAYAALVVVVVVFMKLQTSAFIYFRF
ncbi:MAG: MBOAT family O-acyltransferase [Chloroflexota bacterium]